MLAVSISLFLILLIFLLIIYYSYYKLNYWRRRGVTQIRGTSKIFGNFKNAILFRTAPGFHLGCLHRDSADEPFVGFYIFHKPCLLLKDPKIIKEMLVRNFENFPNRHFAGTEQKDSVGMVNLFGLKNPAWGYARRKVTPTLTPAKLKRMLPLMIETGKPMMDYVKKNVDYSNNEAGVIDFQDVSYRYTADLIANVAFGTKTDTFDNPNSEYSKCLMNFFYSLKRMIALVTVFFMPELVEMVGSTMLFNLSSLSKMFWSAVEARERSGESRGDYIDSIIQLKNGAQDPLYRFEGDNLLYQSGIFFSGFESSSTSTAFILMELAKNKIHQHRVREDIRRAISTHGWTTKAFLAMKYLDKCIAEGIRMYPSISTIDRCALNDYKIPNTDIVIEKGTPIFISLYGLHGDPKYFDNPGVFNPERFDDTGSVPDAIMSFGVGPRKCVGMKAGQLHIKVVLSMILLEYEVHRKCEEPNRFDPRSTFTSAENGINIQFVRLQTA